jgi:SAM-dependent methyltransferase
MLNPKDMMDLKKLPGRLEKEGEHCSPHSARIFSNALGTLIDIVEPPASVLDLGGTSGDHPARDETNGNPQSFGKFFREAGFDYTSFNKADGDLRFKKLPFKSKTFDVVTAWETIEHQWTVEPGGLLKWDGILNFWKEAHRVLKNDGLFFLTTRNRFSPLAWYRFREGKSAQCDGAEITDGIPTPGHVREFTGEELNNLAHCTATYPQRQLFSRSSASAETELNLQRFEPGLSFLLGRDLKPDEKHDTICFLGAK